MAEKKDNNVPLLRREFTKGGLRRADLKPDPIAQFDIWFQQALDVHQMDANAMTLSTVSAAGQPSSRIVLLKGFDERGFIFYTNYSGRKSVDIEQNPRVSLCFYWPALDRQVRIDGKAEKVSRKKSAEYFALRPRESQIGAWASDQSSPAKNRQELEKKFDNMAKQFDNELVPLPNDWGGYVVKPQKMEFWQGRANRLHDRFVYQLDDRNWTIQRLYP